MARNIRIRKLARQLGVPPEELLSVLQEMGQRRFVDPDQTLPGDLADRARDWLTSRPQAQEGQGDFDALMRSQGVVALGGGPAPERRKAPVQRRPTPAPRPAPAHRTDAAPAPKPAPLAATRALERAAAKAELFDRIEHLQESLQGAERAAAAAREEAAAASARVDALQAELAERSERLLRLESELVEREAQLVVLAGEGPELTGGPTTLDAAFEERGLKGRDEQGAAARALIEARRWPELASALEVSRPEALVGFLRRRLTLHCGRDGCPVPANTAPVRVPPSRCEICGGGDPQRALRRLSDAFLLNGYTHVLLVGGRPGEHRLLADALDERVSLSGVPGRAPAAPAALLSEAQLAVLWLGADPSPELAASLEAAGDNGGLRVLRRPERYFGALVAATADALEAAD